MKGMVDGIRVLCSREFWRIFRAYYSPDAVAARLQKWADDFEDTWGRR